MLFDLLLLGDNFAGDVIGSLGIVWAFYVSVRFDRIDDALG